ncbi:hypothetical protein GCM10022207_87030 [Streptomyces lannensis]|uniref:Uncharacterized protein n=1 Tax=Streptomyces lannensis TaxID=766498 RepID=A0ABP7LNJ8_9ACTN
MRDSFARRGVQPPLGARTPASPKAGVRITLPAKPGQGDLPRSPRDNFRTEGSGPRLVVA